MYTVYAVKGSNQDNSLLLQYIRLYIRPNHSVVLLYERIGNLRPMIIWEFPNAASKPLTVNALDCDRPITTVYLRAWMSGGAMLR